MTDRRHANVCQLCGCMNYEYHDEAEIFDVHSLHAINSSMYLNLSQTNRLNQA